MNIPNSDMNKEPEIRMYGEESSKRTTSSYYRMFGSYVVPGAGFEPARVYPYAPQTYVSAKFHHPGMREKL